jgi:hypothetical protein
MESEGTAGQVMLSNTAAAVLQREGFVLDEGPEVKVQDKQVQTSFLRAFEGKYILKPYDVVPIVSSIAVASANSCRGSSWPSKGNDSLGAESQGDAFGSVTGLEMMSSITDSDEDFVA